MNSLFTLASASVGLVSMFDLLLTVIGTIMVCGIGVFLFKQVSNNLDDALSGTFDTIFSFLTKLELGKDNKSLLSATEQNMAMLSENKDDKPNPTDGSGGLGGLMSDNKLAGSVIGASSAVGNALGLGGGFEAAENPEIDNNDTISGSPLMKNTSDEDEKSLAGESATASIVSDEEENAIESTSGSISEHDDEQEESLAGVSGNGAREDEESITQSSTGGSTLSQDMDDEIGGIDAGEIADGEDTESEQTHTNHLDLEQTVDEETDMNLDDADGISADDAALVGMATAASATRMKDLNIDTDTNENMVDDSDGHFADSAGATEGISISGQNLDIDAQNGSISGDEFDANSHDEALDELEGANNGEFSDIDLDDVDNVVAITEGNEMTDYDIRDGSESVDNPYDDGTYSAESDAQKREEMLDTPYADNAQQLEEHDSIHALGNDLDRDRRIERDDDTTNLTDEFVGAEATQGSEFDAVDDANNAFSTDTQETLDGQDSDVDHLVAVGDDVFNENAEYNDGTNQFITSFDEPIRQDDNYGAFDSEANAVDFADATTENIDGSDADLNNLVNVGDSDIDVSSEYNDGQYNHDENFDTPNVNADNYDKFEADTNAFNYMEDNQMSVDGSDARLNNMVNVGDNEVDVASQYDDGNDNYNENLDTPSANVDGNHTFENEAFASNFDADNQMNADGSDVDLNNMVNIGDSNVDVASQYDDGNYNYNENFDTPDVSVGNYNSFEADTNGSQFAESNQVSVAGSTGELDNMVDVGDNDMNVSSEYNDGQYNYNEQTDTLTESDMAHNDFAVDGSAANYQSGLNSSVDGQQGHVDNMVNVGDSDLDVSSDISEGNFNYNNTSESYQGFNDDYGTFGNVDVSTPTINGTQSSQVDGGIGNIDNVVSVGDDTVSVASNYESGSTDYNETSGDYQAAADDFNTFGTVEGQASGANIEGSSHIAGQQTQATQHVSMDGNMVNMDMDIANGDVQYTSDSASINQDMPTFTGDSQFDVNTVNAENISTSVMGDVSDVTQNVDVEHGDLNVSSAFNDAGYGNVNTESPLFNDNSYGSFDGGLEMNDQSVDIADMSYDTSVTGGQVRVDNHTSSTIGQVTHTGSSDTSGAYQSSDTVQADSFKRPNFDSNPLNNHADYNYSDGNTINTSSNIHGDIENTVNSTMYEDIDYSMDGVNHTSSSVAADDYNGNQSNGSIRPQVMGETTSSVTNDDYDVIDVMNTADNTNINHDVIHNQRSTVSNDYDDSSYQSTDYNDLDVFNTPNDTHQVMNGVNSQSIDTENHVDLNVDNMFDVDQHQQFDVNETNFSSSNSQSTFSDDLFGDSFEENPSKNISNSISRKGYVAGNVDMTASEVGLFGDNNYDTFNDVDDNY